MGGDQTKNEGGYKKEQETVTRNIIASGAGGEDFEHFMRRTAKGSATAMVAGEPPFCKCKVPLAECPASELGHTCGRRFLPCPAWQDTSAICCFFKLCGCARRTASNFLDCALPVHQGSSVLEVHTCRPWANATSGQLHHW